MDLSLAADLPIFMIEVTHLNLFVRELMSPISFSFQEGELRNDIFLFEDETISEGQKFSAGCDGHSKSISLAKVVCYTTAFLYRP